MRTILKLALVLGAFAVLALPASADTMGTLVLSNCGGPMSGCPAATYNFDVGNTSAMLTITITGPVTVGTNNTITSVNLGFAPQNDFISLSSTVTTVFQGAAGPNWVGSLDSLNNGNCTTNGGAFACAAPTAMGTPVTIVNGGTYTWTWTYSLVDPSKIFPMGDVHIGTNYGPANGLIVSETINQAIQAAPEPASLLLLGAGLVGIVGLRRRCLA